jgi:hypothetical protein
LQAAKTGAATSAIEAAKKAVHTNRVLHFNNILDAIVAGVFLVLVAAIALLSVREWILLLARRKLAVLRETQPVWLPDFAVAEARPLRVASLLALAFALARELSGQAHLDRAQLAANSCPCLAPEDHGPTAIPRVVPSEAQIYVEATEQRFNGISRCC